MANKKDFSSDAQDVLGITNLKTNNADSESINLKREEQKGKPTQKEGSKFTLFIDKDNLKYLEDVKKIEGKSFKDIINDLIYADREKRQAMLENALEQLEQSRSTFRGK